MTRVTGWLVVRAWIELAAFDVFHSLGRRNATAFLASAAVRSRQGAASAQEITEAFALARCLYWKQVRCLQHSLCLTRLLRSRGVPARVVIGYRTRPIVCHAWVESGGVAGRESHAYAERLRVLHTI